MEKILFKGNGTESEPYLISSQTDLETFAKDVNSGNSYEGKFIKLTDNIECNYNRYNQWTPIGNYSNEFKGTFDGNKKIISCLYKGSLIYVGLFGINNGTIKNIGITDSFFCATSYSGGISGINKGTITNCYVRNREVIGDKYVGGLCGANSGTLENCYNTSTINGRTCIGGVCGICRGVIKNCQNRGMISGEINSQYIGGICGYLFKGTILNCRNSGNVNSKEESDYIDGICGYNHGNIQNSYNFRMVSIKHKSENTENKDNSNETTLNCNSFEVIDVENDIKTKEQFSSDTCELLPESSGLLDSAIAYARYVNKNIPFNMIDKLVKAYITGAMTYNIFNTGFSFIINNTFFKSSPYFCKECPFKSKILDKDYCLAKHSYVNKEDVIPTECKNTFFECEYLGGTWEITNPNTMDLELVL